MRILLALCCLTLVAGLRPEIALRRRQLGRAASSTRTPATPTSCRSGATSGSTSATSRTATTASSTPCSSGLFMWLTAGLTGGVQHVLTGVSDIQVFGGLTCLLLGVCALVTVMGTAGAAGKRPYDAALFALSPLLVFHAFSNWDLIAMAFASCALWAWAREKPVATGVLIGLGTAAKLYPVFLLVPILILAWRTGRWREAAWALASAAAELGRGQRHRRLGVLRRLAGVLRVQHRPRRRGQHVLVHGPLPDHRRLGRRLPARTGSARASPSPSPWPLRSPASPGSACRRRCVRAWPSSRSSPCWRS